VSLTVSAAENPDLINFGPTTTYSLKSGYHNRPIMRWGFVSLILAMF
jgi:hypothetical protein